MMDGIEVPEVAEVGGKVGDERVRLDRRVYLQLLAFTSAANTAEALAALDHDGIPAALYEDVNDARGIGIVVAFEDPARFVTDLRPVLGRPPFAGFTPRPEYTMLGRTYAIGYERDLEATLIRKPFDRLTNRNHQWTMWYPLRRTGSYETLSPEEKHDVQVEHMQAGISFARAGHIADVRLAAHGLGTEDNDFVLALFGENLHRLSLVVQMMRKSTQTSLYIERLGPFFVGRNCGRTRALMEHAPATE